MKSQLPKVMHRLARATLLAHVLGAAKGASIDRTALVIAPGMEEVATAASALDSKLQTFVQAEQRGTADAVKAAREAFEDFQGHVLILYGDTPLLRPETLVSVRGELEAGAGLVVVGVEVQHPTRSWPPLFAPRGQ